MKRWTQRTTALIAMMLLFTGIILTSNVAYAQDTDTTTVQEQGKKAPWLVDEAGLLTHDEVEKLTEALEDICHRQSVDVVVYIQDEPIGNPAQAADDYFDQNGFGYGSQYDGVLLYINMYTRDWYISTSGSCVNAFTDKGIEYIGDKIKGKLGDGDYYNAIDTYIFLCDEFLNEASTGHPYDVGHMPKGKMPIFRNIGISLVVGMVVAVLYTLYLWSKLKSVAPNHYARDYVVDQSMNITESREIYLYRTVRVVPKAESSGGGGSSTHTSSSGRTHGGGGGKF